MTTDNHVCDSGWFDRTICPPPCGAMHSYCDTCGKRQDPCPHGEQREALAAMVREGEAAGMSTDHGAAGFCTDHGQVAAIAERDEARAVLAALREAVEGLLGAYPTGCDGLGCGGWDDLAADLHDALAAAPSETETGQ